MSRGDSVIVRLTHSQQVARFARELHGLFVDFLKRAHEPFSVEQQWAALLASLGQPHILFLVGFNDRMRPVGYLLAQSGADWWGLVYANVVQLYTKPGTPSSVVDEFNTHLERWADEQGAQMLSGLTNRDSPGYEKWMQRHGFQKGPTTYYKIKKVRADGEKSAGATTSHGDDSGRVPALRA